MTNTILTYAQIKAILAAEYTTVIEDREYTPWFMDSITDLEEEMDCECELWEEPDSEQFEEDNIIPFPSYYWEPTNTATSGRAA